MRVSADRELYLVVRIRRESAHVLGNEGALDVLAVYYIPGMGHGGAPYDQVIAAQIDALEAWIDHRQSKGRAGAPAPAMIGAYPREPKSGGRHRNRFSDQENNR